MESEYWFLTIATSSLASRNAFGLHLCELDYAVFTLSKHMFTCNNVKHVSSLRIIDGCVYYVLLCTLFEPCPVFFDIFSSSTCIPQGLEGFKKFCASASSHVTETVVTTSSRLLPMYPPPVLSVPGVVTTSLKLFNQFPGTLHIHLMLDTIQRPPSKIWSWLVPPAL